MAREIELRRSKEGPQVKETVDSTRLHLERGDRNLRERQYKIAEQLFGNALRSQPDDPILQSQIAGLLYGYARSMARHSRPSAQEAVQMAARLLPAVPVPSDLAEALAQTEVHAREETPRAKEETPRSREETPRWSSLNRLIALGIQVEAAKKREELTAARAEVEEYSFFAAKHPDLKEAVCALFLRIEDKADAINAKRARVRIAYRAVSIAAIVLFGIGLAYWMYEQAKPPIATPVESAKEIHLRFGNTAKSAAMRASGHSILNQTRVFLGLLPPHLCNCCPVAANTGSVVMHSHVPAPRVMNLAPKPARLEIRDAAPNTRIEVDGILLAKAPGNNTLTKELSAGQHLIEVSRDGFVSKTLIRKVTPGEVTWFSRK